MRQLVYCLFFSTWAATAVAAETKTYLLKSDLAAGDTWTASVKLSVGGDLHVQEQSQIEKLPLRVVGKLRYEERLLAWSQDEIARSLRHYATAAARIQVGEEGLIRELPAESRQVIAEIRDQLTALNGSDKLLTREQLDLLNVVGNTLAVHRLLPGRSLAEGESWDHPATTIGPLLGLDYVAVCEVSSVVTGAEQDQVQIRLAGTVHGTVDGAPTEMDLRGAYLFHLTEKRITKFNLAIKELRTASEIVPGLDIVAKISLTLDAPAHPTNITPEQVQQADDLSQPVRRELLFDAHAKGFRFHHDKAWYVTGEKSDLISLRCMHEGNLVAHCNVATLPARSEGRFTTLEQFEHDVRTSLGDNLKNVVASTRWVTARGYECLGVIANGNVEEVPIEWRYYLVSADGLPRVSLSVTVEHSKLKQFADGDRQLVDSLELMAKPVGVATRTR
ncbi:MAG: hypothetical protein MI725_09070 [Pirellulales bacterium]|nr:hypothetical protein [Pirellulales bacterium]